MKELHGFWIPDYDQNMEANLSTAAQFAGRATYQLDAFQLAFSHIKTFRHGVDIGAHVGLFSVMMARCFAEVTAFEPVSDHADCYRLNVRGAVLHQVALGAAAGMVEMALKPPVSFKARVRTSESAGQAVDMRTLDSFDLKNVDFIKIDVEGYELPVILGGERTIKEQRPTILVEQKIGHLRYDSKEIAMSRLIDWGAIIVGGLHGDYLLKWK